MGKVGTVLMREVEMVGHGITGLLLTAIGGYWVLERASEHKGQLKQVGLLLGSLIIITSLVGAVAQIWSMSDCRGMMGKNAGWHPMMSQPDQTAPKR